MTEEELIAEQQRLFASARMYDYEEDEQRSGSFDNSGRNREMEAGDPSMMVHEDQ